MEGYGAEADGFNFGIGDEGENMSLQLFCLRLEFDKLEQVFCAS